MCFQRGFVFLEYFLLLQRFRLFEQFAGAYPTRPQDGSSERERKDTRLSESSCPAYTR